MENRFKEGDTVLLKGSRKDHLVTITGDLFRLTDPQGAFDTGRLIGMEEGGKLKVGSRSFVVLRPDVLDHVLNLERGAQLIIPKDSSRIIMGLGLSSGSRVLEGGAGSGALTIALLNSVAPGGEVTTYEIRNDHLEKARGNVERTGYSSLWNGKIGDVYRDVDEREMDAFVVDVPEPEMTVDAALSSLRHGGRFCSYVPTSNQMERCVMALRKAEFKDIHSMEIIERQYSVKEGATRPVTEMLSHTGFLVFARKL